LIARKKLCSSCSQFFPLLSAVVSAGAVFFSGTPFLFSAISSSKPTSREFFFSQRNRDCSPHWRNEQRSRGWRSILRDQFSSLSLRLELEKYVLFVKAENDQKGFNGN